MTTEPKNTDYLLTAPKHKAIPEPYATSGHNVIPEVYAIPRHNVIPAEAGIQQ